MSTKEEVVKLLNKGLELEHAARIQYLAHAEQITGLNAEKIIERLQELAGDEQKHEEKFRTMIGSYLGGEPSMGMSETFRASDTGGVLEINLKKEKEAIDFYKHVYQKVVESKDNLPYVFETIEHELRHIIIDEEEHVMEIKTLLAK